MELGTENAADQACLLSLSDKQGAGLAGGRDNRASKRRLAGEYFHADACGFAVQDLSPD